MRETFYPIREDYERFSIGSVILRLCHDAAPENEPNEALFSLLYHTLSFLSYGQSDPQDLFCCFLIRYLNTIGYRPSITACAQCGRDIVITSYSIHYTKLYDLGSGNRPQGVHGHHARQCGDETAYRKRGIHHGFPQPRAGHGLPLLIPW